MVSPRGCITRGAKGAEAHPGNMLSRARRDALWEGVRWGEPHIFFLAPGVVSWMVPLVDGDVVLGGVSGGEIRPAEDPFDARPVSAYLQQAGWSRNQSARFLAGLPVWPADRSGEAARALYELIYSFAPWVPRLLVRNRENARQQRQIAEAIQARKEGAARVSRAAEERKLLALIRVGDRNGARGVLNDALADMFLRSPRPAVLRARAIELMGYLVRAAVEDSPVLEPLLERHQGWIERLVEADEFEALCAVLRDTLDDFIDSIHLQGYNRTSRPVQKALRYVAANYSDRILLRDVATACGLSTFRIAHLIKDVTGQTVGQHVRRLRIERACELLETSPLGHAEIAYEVGFSDQSYFIRQFRAVTGTTPGRYRRERRLS